MRNWNPRPEMPTNHWPDTFSAYLWGIETRRRLRVAAAVRRFQPTYEELKPGAGISRFTHYTWSFQPTYEELKQQNPFSKPVRTLPFSAYLWGIETENGQDIGVFAYYVFSLPMRNWNKGSSLFFWPLPKGFQPTYEELKLYSNGTSSWNKSPMFSAYLWGIETGPLTGTGLSATPFSAYLWGIETQTKLVNVY